MAETFKRLLQRDVGTSRSRIGTYTVAAATKVIVLGITVSNKTGAQVLADVEHHDGTNYTYLIKSVAIPTGASFVTAGDTGKIVLDTGDGIFVKSDTATSLDVIVSILEIT